MPLATRYTIVYPFYRDCRCFCPVLSSGETWKNKPKVHMNKNTKTKDMNSLASVLQVFMYAYSKGSKLLNVTTSLLSSCPAEANALLFQGGAFNSATELSVDRYCLVSLLDFCPLFLPLNNISTKRRNTNLFQQRRM